jgi:hypothetical protein
MEKDLALTRTVVIFDSTNNTKYEFKTNSTKWADVVELAKAGGVNLNNKKAILRENSSTLELPNADIPEGDQIIYLTPSKQNSGSKDLEVMSYVDLRRAAKGLPGSEKLGSNPTKDELKKVIKASYKDEKPKAKKEAVVNLKKKADETAPDLAQKVADLEQMVLTQNVNLANFITTMKTAILATEANMNAVISFEQLPKTGTITSSSSSKVVTDTKKVKPPVDINMSESELAAEARKLGIIK